MLIFALLFAYGLKLASNGEDLYRKLAKATGIVADTTWIIEMVDLVKDWIYLFMFKHVRLAYITLLTSITFPMSLACSFWSGSYGNTFIKALLEFMGFTVDSEPKEKRVICTVAIALLENVP